MIQLSNKGWDSKKIQGTSQQGRGVCRICCQFRLFLRMIEKITLVELWNLYRVVLCWVRMIKLVSNIFICRSKLIAPGNGIFKCKSEKCFTCSKLIINKTFKSNVSQFNYYLINGSRKNNFVSFTKLIYLLSCNSLLSLTLK